MEEIYFAFHYPYTFTALEEDITRYKTIYHKHNKIYFHADVIARSLEGRSIHMLTISSYDGMSKEREVKTTYIPQPGKRPHKFEKNTVLITARVHPGEVQGSHVMNGIIKLLLNEYYIYLNNIYRKREWSRVLRKRFVFKLVPMLNPDGVYRGYFRLNTKSQNLNRFYIEPLEVYIYIYNIYRNNIHLSMQ